ncbi:MAG: hypothetical protein OK456_05715 [Thaumarchaeota archaeon]|nr:hypothetical protein [Nitrososphaerota archaeon]
MPKELEYQLATVIDIIELIEESIRGVNDLHRERQKLPNNDPYSQAENNLIDDINWAAIQLASSKRTLLKIQKRSRDEPSPAEVSTVLASTLDHASGLQVDGGRVGSRPSVQIGD